MAMTSAPARIAPASVPDDPGTGDDGNGGDRRPPGRTAGSTPGDAVPAGIAGDWAALGAGSAEASGKAMARIVGHDGPHADPGFLDSIRGMGCSCRYESCAPV